MAAHKRAPAPDTFFFWLLLPLAPPFKSAMSPKMSRGSSTPPPVQGAGLLRFLPPVADRPDAMASSARALARSSSLAAKAFSMIASHSNASIKPSPDVSRVLIDFSIFSGIKQILEVLVAAVLDEGNDLLVRRDARLDLVMIE